MSAMRVIARVGSRIFDQVIQNLIHQRLNAHTRAFSTPLSTEIVDNSAIGSMRRSRTEKWRNPRRMGISARNQETR
jgi:hypothetical protein